VFFMMCVPRECTESFWEGHVRAFEFFGGVPAPAATPTSPTCGRVNFLHPAFDGTGAF
jgi:hypothetical protein